MPLLVAEVECDGKLEIEVCKTAEIRPKLRGAAGIPPRRNDSRVYRLRKETRRMQIGMVGLGRTGSNMVRRLMREGHDCVVFDVNPANVETMAREAD